ncbi:hypothetical protein NL676_005015 [Syzygium grande]|nr:hypothetical protein NL676_005015 [Syzygium grande]
MASHFLAIILIVCTFCSVGGIEARRFLTTPEAPNAGEVKPSSVVPPPSPKWATSRGVEDWDPPTPTKPTPSPEEEPAVPDSGPVVTPVNPGLPDWEPRTPPKTSPGTAKEPAVPGSDP